MTHDPMPPRRQLAQELENLCIKLRGQDSRGLFGLRSTGEVRAAAVRQGVNARGLPMTPLGQVLVRSTDEAVVRAYRKWRRKAIAAKEAGDPVPAPPEEAQVPLDMAGVREKAARGAFASHHAFMKDVRQVLDRAEAYARQELSMGNRVGTVILKQVAMFRKAADTEVVRQGRLEKISQAVRRAEAGGDLVLSL